MTTPTRILALLGALLLAAAQAPAPAPAEALPPLRAVTSVYDGDTLTVSEDGNVRMAGLDTPEIGHRARCVDEDELGHVARFHTESRSRLGVRLQRSVDDRGRLQPDREKWGRLLRFVFAADGGDIRAELIGMDLAAAYWGRGPRRDWCAPGASSWPRVTP